LFFYAIASENNLRGFRVSLYLVRTQGAERFYREMDKLADPARKN
jgi:hypothetical protein